MSDFIPNADFVDEFGGGNNDFDEFAGGGSSDFPAPALDPQQKQQAQSQSAPSGHNAPSIKKQTTGNRTIYVTHQFRTFEDEYVKVGSIGEPGQFGTAYECYLKTDISKRRRCVKEINKSRFHHISVEARNDVLATMQNEIATLKKVDHPNIVKLYDVYEDRHFLHLVMEFLPGGELFERIADTSNPFTERKAASILKQILEALDHMHDQNILHLDLKPDNILFADRSPDAPIKLIDFGMARVVPRLAKLKDRVGTPNYMAPEVFGGNYSKAADVWSVGIILFCCLFGFPPFYADANVLHLDEFEQLEAKVQLGFDPNVKPGFGAWFPQDIEVSDNCRYVISRMLDMDVKKRWTVKECLSSQWVRGFCDDVTIPAIVRDALRKFHGTCKFKVAISNMFIHQLDQDHVQGIKKFFEELDADGDGAITLKEFKNGMVQKFHTDLSEEQLDSIFSTVDLDGGRTITFDELITITTHRMLVDEDERLYQAFDDLDKDGDGFISKQELSQAMSRINNQFSSTQGKAVMRRVSTAFNVADVNSDGNIDYEEFLRMLHPEFTSDMTLDTFKDQKTPNVKAARYNMNASTQAVDVYLEPRRNSAMRDDREQVASFQKNNSNSNNNNNTMASSVSTSLPALSERNNNDANAARIADLKDKIEKLQRLMTDFQSKNEKLLIRANNAEEARDSLRNQYEKDLFNKFQSQTAEINQMRNDWQQKHNKQINQLQEKLHLKDDRIERLNASIDQKNLKIEQINRKFSVQMSSLQQEIIKKDTMIKDAETMLQHAIESKMRSLHSSHAEIAKLKSMLAGQEVSVIPNNNNQSMSIPGRKSSHTRHLSFGIAK